MKSGIQKIGSLGSTSAKKILSITGSAPKVLAIALMALGTSAQAFEFDTGSDVKMRWDNTLKYSTAYRVKNADSSLLSDPNQDDGNRNFDKGIISNRVDVLSEFDIKYRDFGARLSGAGWYDSVYNRANDNNSPATVNAFSAKYDHFTDETRTMHGRKAELLDAFVYANLDLDNHPTTVRLGKHTVLYGESIFFGLNGIAGAQAPVDIIKAVSVPGSQVKEILMPVNQASVQTQINPNLSFGAYYQFKWEKDRLPGVGSYFSGQDLVGPGMERLLIVPGLVSLYEGGDKSAKDSGQGGVQVRFRPFGGNVEYGLYALNYHSKLPWVVLTSKVPSGPPADYVGSYGLVYPENTQLYGASFSTSLGDANVAGEFSIRTNAPLAAPLGVPIGKTGHGQISFINTFAKTALWDSASVVGEVAWNRLLSVKKNESLIEPLATRDAWGMRVLFEPTWYQVVPALDLSMPINIGFSPKAKSAAAPVGGVNNGGDLTIGLNGDYAKQYKFGLSFTHYFGSSDTLLLAPDNRHSYKQNMADRDFISFNVQSTF